MFFFIFIILGSLGGQQCVVMALKKCFLSLGWESFSRSSVTQTQTHKTISFSTLIASPTWLCSGAGGRPGGEPSPPPGPEHWVFLSVFQNWDFFKKKIKTAITTSGSWTVSVFQKFLKFFSKKFKTGLWLIDQGNNMMDHQCNVDVFSCHLISLDWNFETLFCLQEKCLSLTLRLGRTLGSWPEAIYLSRA